MNLYTKPVIKVDTGIAEGIYAASGSASASIPVTFVNVVNNWGNGGQAKFSVDLSGVNSSQLTIILTFNMEISSGWADGAENSSSGKELTLTWYSAPTSADVTVQVSGDITNLECTGSRYYNA